MLNVECSRMDAPFNIQHFSFNIQHLPLSRSSRPSGHRVAERERGSFSNWSTEARPFARSTVVGSEVGAKLKGLDELLKIFQGTKKGRYAPSCRSPARIAVLR